MYILSGSVAMRPHVACEMVIPDLVKRTHVMVTHTSTTYAADYAISSRGLMLISAFGISNKLVHFKGQFSDDATFIKHWAAAWTPNIISKWVICQSLFLSHPLFVTHTHTPCLSSATWIPYRMRRSSNHAFVQLIISLNCRWLGDSYSR